MQATAPSVSFHRMRVGMKRFRTALVGCVFFPSEWIASFSFVQPPTVAHADPAPASQCSTAASVRLQAADQSRHRWRGSRKREWPFHVGWGSRHIESLESVS